MRKKRIAAALIVTGLAALTFTECKKDKYADVRIYLNDLKDYTIEHGKKMERAQTGSDVAKAINEYTDMTIDFTKKGKELQERFPELKEDEPPAELKKEFAELENAAEQLNEKSAPVFAKFIDDPNVLKAITDMAERMQKEF